MKTVNKFIKFFERAISFILNLFWVPWFISPPDGTAVDYMTTDGYVLSGSYKDGKFHMYPEKRGSEDTYGWRFRGQITLPKIQSRGRAYNTTFLFDPSSDHVWEYVDPAGKKHHVTYNTYKQMSENPMATTLEGKRKKLQQQSDKARQKKHEKVSKIKGNSL